MEREREESKLKEKKEKDGVMRTVWACSGKAPFTGAIFAWIWLSLRACADCAQLRRDKDKQACALLARSRAATTATTLLQAPAKAEAHFSRAFVDKLASACARAARSE